MKALFCEWLLRIDFILPPSSFIFSSGGEGGIRTHGGLSPTPVFETGFAPSLSYDEPRYANKHKLREVVKA